jgi:flagellar biosynthesis/type III secretory pathway M-ring protein FliF/YscJ
LLILFLDLLQIAAIGSITVLFIHAITHLGHLKLLNKTKASKILVVLALIITLGVIVLFLIYSIKDSYTILILSAGVLALSFLIEILIRAITKRKVDKTREGIFGKIFR